MDAIRDGIGRLVTRVFGTKSERDLKKLLPLVAEINNEYEKLGGLSDGAVQEKTDEFRRRIADGAAVDDLLPEAFAVVKEACRRHCGKSWPVVEHETPWEMLPFDMQLIGGVVLHQGKISEMATGEGKTLVAIFPLYLNALAGKGAHLVTVNDYLARRDSEWVGAILRWLGLSVGCIQHGMDNVARREAYASDVTYGTNNEFGFDYLRDNMVTRGQDRVQRPHSFAIVDEVDSVLIDEARTPLIISGPVAQSFQHFDRLRGSVESLVRHQNTIVGRFLESAQELLEAGGDEKRYEAGVRLLQARRGAPRNKRLIKLTSDVADLQKLIHRVENDFMRDKRLHELDDDLLFSIDERGHSVSLSDQGRSILSPNDDGMFVLPDLAEEIGRIDEEETLSLEEKIKRREMVHQRYAEKSEMLSNVQQLLRAHCLYEKDKEYVVQDGKVIIVDEFTGRLMPGRRYSDGLHQALEAKERVTVGEENQTLATITIQNYFRLYKKLAGMTGTAETEAGEFWEIYKLDVVVIPTNEPIRRVDYDDLIFKTRKEKYSAVLDEIERVHGMGRPALVGTVSVEVSETISRMLKRRGIKHNVLNAKHHQSEAEVVSQAGRVGAVTIATNMAGRGTDIKLAREVVKGRVCLINSNAGQGDCDAVENVRACASDMPCGLHIIGTERHESRRIDRQLRGRSGRQGDPGSSLFFLSLEDDLMRLFMSDKLAGMMERLGVQEGEVITHRFVTKAIERAQKRVEGHNFQIRKHLLDYDNVMNQQREVVYQLRNAALDEGDLSGRIRELVHARVEEMVDLYLPVGTGREQWDLRGLQGELESLILLPMDRDGLDGASSREDVHRVCMEGAHTAYAQREDVFGSPRMREIERWVQINVIDQKWRDHLYEIDQLRGGIGLRAYAQKDPLLEYKSEAYRMFKDLIAGIESDTVRYLFRVMPAAPARPPVRPASSGAVQTVHAEAGVFGRGGEAKGSASGTSPGRAPAPAQHPGGAGPGTLRRNEPKIGRNEPCPCGSGKKYKKCCGLNE